MRTWLNRAVLGGLLLGAAVAAPAGPWRDRLEARRAERAERDDGAAQAPTQAGRVFSWSYGPDRRQSLDVHLPAQAGGQVPVVFMVHGGAWAVGDKARAPVVANKVAHWGAMGVAVVSVNYRMLPETAPLEQARDVARALALLQQRGPALGLDPARLVLMGHSAGAHLVALLSAQPALAREVGAEPRWLGTVSLDNATLDVEATMRERHLPLYDRAFGERPERWREVSPLVQLQGALTGQSWLLVCSSPRREACGQAQRFAQRAQSLGGTARVLPQALSHGEINERLGERGAYTEAVDDYLRQVGLW